MSKAKMTGRERLLTAINHQEPDRVPISPRMFAWLWSVYGNIDLETQLKYLPDNDLMHIVDEPTPNYLDMYPNEYHLKDIRVEQKKYIDNDMLIVKRAFHTPAGTLTDCTHIPPAGREYGVSPNPHKTEYLVKEKSDLAALEYILPPINKNYDFLQSEKKLLGDRGVVMVCVRSALDHHAGYARDVQDLMIDYYENRELLDALLDIFHKRSLEQIKAACEGGAEFIFGSWYFASLSSGWSPAFFKEVFVPKIKDHVDLTHQYNALYDYYDDGKLKNSMEMIADTGVDVLETCTPPPVGDMDLAEAKEKIGAKTTLKGHTDLLYVVQRGTPEHIDKTVKQAMEVAKPGGGFIIGSSDSFRDGTPRENLEAYFKACKKYGTY